MEDRVLQIESQIKERSRVPDQAYFRAKKILFAVSRLFAKLEEKGILSEEETEKMLADLHD